MSDIAEKAWFYSRQGDQSGPVSFKELKELASNGSLNPRHDMAWTTGMAEWKPAGEIDGLFAKAGATPQPGAVTIDGDPYEPPMDPWADPASSQNTEWPGARRRSFYFMTMVFPFLCALIIGVASPLLQRQFSQTIMISALVITLVVMVVLMIYYGLQRLVNLGMSRWWYLGNLVPFLNIWVSYRMYVCPAGYAYHKKLDTIGVVLAILFWLMIALYVLVVAVQIAMLSGAVDMDWLQQILQNAIPSEANQ